MSHLFWSHDVCDIPCDITPLLTSFLASKGMYIHAAWLVSHSCVVIRYSADSTPSAVLVWAVAVIFGMSMTVAQLILVNLSTVVGWVSLLSTPTTLNPAIVWAGLPPISEVGNSFIEDSG